MYIHLQFLGRQLSVSAQWRDSAPPGRNRFLIPELMPLLAAQKLPAIHHCTMCIPSDLPEQHDFHTPARDVFLQSHSQMSEQEASRVTLIPYAQFFPVLERNFLSPCRKIFPPPFCFAPRFGGRNLSFRTLNLAVIPAPQRWLMLARFCFGVVLLWAVTDRRLLVKNMEIRQAQRKSALTRLSTWDISDALEVVQNEEVTLKVSLLRLTLSVFLLNECQPLEHKSGVFVKPGCVF